MLNLLRQALTSRTVTYRLDSEDLQLPPPPTVRGKKRTRSNFHVVMNAHVQEPTKKDAAVANKHTGFPEPFSEDRNTTLPHPEADTSPNATIEAPDVDLTRTHSRSSFLHRKHHSHHLWNSHDTPEKMGLYDNITYADDDTETLAPEHIEKANGVDGIHEEVEQKKGLLKKLVMHKA